MKNQNKNQVKSPKINIWQIFAALGVLFGLAVALITFGTYIDSRVRKIVYEDEFIKKVAKHVRPSIIFDSKGRILIDIGGMEYIDKITVIPRPDDHPNKVIVTPKKYLVIAPILTVQDGSVAASIKSERGTDLDWEYNIEYISGPLTSQTITQYRLEIFSFY